MTTDFQDRVALVTGGSRGIGRAVALRLADDGADVAITYATRRDAADETVRQIEALGRRGLALACNVALPAEVGRVVATAAERLGPIDLLAHCGAVSNLADHSQLTYELWKETIDVNLTGTYNAIHAVKDGMIARRYGRIVTVSSIAALLPRKLQIHYAASKAGVLAVTRCYADALAPYNVRVNCVAPGLTETEMAHVLPEETIRQVVAATPLGRIGQPEEIASVIRFLLCDESSYMTGQTVVACGGRMMLG